MLERVSGCQSSATVAVDEEATMQSVKRWEVLYSGFRWDHHDERSGYHHVVASTEDYVDGGKLWGGDSKIGSLKRRINFALIDLWTVLKSWRYPVVLIFYPEQTSYFSAPLLRLMGKKVVYVLHLGEDYWIERSDSLFLKLKRFNLRFVSKFIVLTSQQENVFEKHFPNKVMCIPHGAWCDKERRPTSRAPGATECVTVVGDTYRDYELLNQIIFVFRERYPQIKLNLVGMKYDKLGEARHSLNVVCHGRLSKSEYEEVIRDSLFMLLPLTFATANNALLEGISFGIPVICNSVQGVLEYLPGHEYVFNSIDDLCIMVDGRLNLNEAGRNQEAVYLANYLEANYAWGSIRDRVSEYCLEGLGR